MANAPARVFRNRARRAPKDRHMLPGYVSLHARGQLAARARQALELLNPCRLCPRRCGVDRTSGETGFCGVGRYARVASFGPHFGEEDCLVGEGGSGTIFFSGCNLGCVFCQNEDISRHPESGGEVSPAELAAIMLDLQGRGCANINFVTPSHVAAQILEALPLAVEGGLTLPLVYNTGGYDNLKTLALLDGVVDVYMPDVKFWDPAVAARLCAAADYPEVARAAVQAMHSQAGDLEIGPDGLARRGLLVRHLVLPQDLAGTARWMTWLASEVSPGTYVNLMDQYRPCADAGKHPGLGRALTAEEFRRARRQAQGAGITRLDERKAGYLKMILARMLAGDPEEGGPAGD
ncbi:radical SAM protein [Fundidesulfovibrio terrae]|uniref:radical SAM protein n=1 Tax=Fundidesulfovibrio terrae TaxID=2922866 RepID=UPI00311AB79D